MRRHVFSPQTLFTYCIHISLTAGRGNVVFLTVTSFRKFHAYPRINRSTKWHPRVRYKRYVFPRDHSYIWTFSLVLVAIIWKWAFTWSRGLGEWKKSQLIGVSFLKPWSEVRIFNILYRVALLAIYFKMCLTRLAVYKCYWTSMKERHFKVNFSK